jgi:N-acetylneuraminic acid mutarotase
MFGGQEDDNRKLNDIWSFDCDEMVWTQIEQGEDDYKPTKRSGHTTVVFGQKMYIFGGILELTHELNDLVVFDIDTKKFSSNSETAIEG